MKMGKAAAWLLTATAIAAAGFALWRQLVPETVTEQEPVLIVEDQRMTAADPFYEEDGRLYLKTEVLESMGISGRTEPAEKRFWVSAAAGRVDYEDAVVSESVRAEAGDLNYPLKVLNMGTYVELERFGQWLGIESTYVAEKRLLILDTAGDRAYGLVRPGSFPLHGEPGGKGKRLRDLVEGERLRLFSESGRYFRVRTEDGLLGYCAKEAVVPYARPEAAQTPFTLVRRPQSIYGPVNLTFEYVGSYAGNPDLSKEEKVQGLDVLCPTWFSLDEEARVTNDASVPYVREAHRMGYRVWGVFKNGFEPERTHLLLEDPARQEQAVAALCHYSAFYELDGINVDFENVRLKDREALSGFLERLDAALTRQGVLLSVDAAVPWGSDQWSLFLDREAAARVADYVVLMAYDEHYANSPESGSVASLGWTEKAVSETLNSVPADKLLLGMPLYTRVWEETPDGSGGITVSSTAIGMNGQEAFLKGKGARLEWDGEAGQMQAVYVEAGKTYRIWLEDETSVRARLELARRYQLAGVASWRRGFESDWFWKTVRDHLKER